MEAELNALNAALGEPEGPVAAVVGGAKVSTKLDLLKNLVGKLDTLAIGGGMANTFLAARGVNVGKSLCEHDLTGTAEVLGTPLARLRDRTLTVNGASKTYAMTGWRIGFAANATLAPVFTRFFGQDLAATALPTALLIFAAAFSLASSGESADSSSAMSYITGRSSKRWRSPRTRLSWACTRESSLVTVCA